MWPVLLIVGIGRRKPIPLPFPLFLFWPFILIGWMVAGLITLIRRIHGTHHPSSTRQSRDSRPGRPSDRQPEIIQGGDEYKFHAEPKWRRADEAYSIKTRPEIPLGLALTAFTKLHGLRIDVRSKDNHKVYFLII
ncbi:MAG: hypothetical protein KJ970_01240 [Candidatus Eisenbacteria bacterium]|uniref:Uncharacterized protein n=1 Tax=Eiseniibacteriota bacterium TaxID=2212470 RepID=A0A948RS03_UNCEI|nr:hypothetical protein [Candidatus Eisenbacteria bacterium]MBU1948507.1 hypothetical protein [Candidatus Eisenbacteria bacterium]MBU2689526.1 hypothetical protein [Candidatus Eisenbacteria bacterium]